MTIQIADATQSVLAGYQLSPLFRIDRPLPGGGFRISSGNGRGRETLAIDHPGVVRWLITQCPDATRDALAGDLSARLGILAGDAASLVDVLIERGFLIPAVEADSLRTAGCVWETNGWRDAFDFHFSVYGQEWDRTRSAEYEDALRSLYDDTARVGPQPPSVVNRDGPRVDLRPYVQASRATLEDVLLNAVPMNVFTEIGITLESLATVLHEAHGVRFTRDLVLGEHLFKASPSGGARHPVEVYVAAREVDGLEPGVYHYVPKTSELVRIRGQESVKDFDATCFDKGGIRTSSAILFLTYRFLRHAWKYRYSRTYRMVLMELGHNAQATRVAAASAALDVYYNPAIDDRRVSRLLKLPEDCDEGPMLSIGLGRGGVV